MSNCSNDVSSQMKALSAKIERIDNHLLAHTAQSVIDALAFLSSGPFNPALIVRGAVKLAESLAYKLLIRLVERLPGVKEFKQLMLLDAASIVTALESTIIQTVDNLIDTAVKDLEDAIDEHIRAFTQHLFAILDPLGIRTLNGTASGSTSSTLITTSITDVNYWISPGDSILLASNGTIIGSVSSVDEISITLTSNSTIDFTDAVIAYSPINPDAIVEKLLGSLNLSISRLVKNNAALSAIKLFWKTLMDISQCQIENAEIRRRRASELEALDEAINQQQLNDLTNQLEQINVRY